MAKSSGDPEILTLDSALWITVPPTFPLISLFPTISCVLEKKLREWWGHSVCVCTRACTYRGVVWERELKLRELKSGSRILVLISGQ